MSAVRSAVNASLELYDCACREKTAQQIDDAYFMQSLEQIIGREEGFLVSFGASWSRRAGRREKSLL